MTFHNKIYEVNINTSCKDFNLIFDEPYCADIKCEYDKSKGIVLISVPNHCEDGCVYARLECLDTQDCDHCGQTTERIKFCPCNTDSDCPECEKCVDNICVSTCDEGEFCKDDVCVECDEDNPCEGGKDCNNGICECPPSKPFLDENGNCVECEHGMVMDCLYCDKGVWVDKECVEGVCDPDTDNCVDCLKSGDCTKDNECCVDKDCVCCPGFVRDVTTGECIPEPECSVDSDCPDCFVCTDEGCVPVVCPEGFICVDGDCVLECNCSTGGCPDQGSSCVPHPTIEDKCYCKDCTQFDCDQCADEFGCGCQDDENCLPDNSCNLSELDLEWVFTEGDTGTPEGSEVPLSLVSTTITPRQQVYNNTTNSTYRNYEFTVEIASVNNGQWYYVNGVNTISLPSTGNTVSIELEDLQQNLGFFALRYIDNSPCRRTITIPFAPNTNISNPLQAESNGWAALTPDNSGGCNAFSGGTSGYWSLCVNSSTSFEIDATSLDIITTDTIDISLDGQVGNCSRATITGCGVANGTVDVVCKGLRQTVSIPEFIVDLECCDPSDPSCVTTGEPCDEITIENLPITIMPLFGTDSSGTVSEAVAIIDALQLFISGEFNVNEFISLGSKICWSSIGNSMSSNTNEVVTEGNSFQQGFSNPFEFKFDYISGTCIQVGVECDIIVGCKQYRGQNCIDRCDNFEVVFLETGVDGEYFMIPSNFGLVTGSEDWKIDAFTNVNSTTPSLTTTLQPAQSTFAQIIGGSIPGVSLTLNNYFVDVMSITLGSKIKKVVGEITLNDCNGQGTLVRFTRGCTNPFSCNFNPDADIDDGSCEILEATVTYDCNGGGLQAYASINGVPQTGITLLQGGFVRNIGDTLSQGVYTFTVVVNGCSSSPVTLEVDCCATSNIVISNISSVCDNGSGSSQVSFDVSGGLENYDISLVDSSSNTVSTLTGEAAGNKVMTVGSILTGQETYTIVVTDSNSCESSQLFGFLCCTAPSQVFFDDGAGGNPSASVTGNNQLSLMNLVYPSSGTTSICSLGTFTMTLQSTGDVLNGQDITVTSIGDLKLGYDGNQFAVGVPTVITYDSSIEFTFSFENISSGSSLVRIEYCGSIYTFNFIHDCSESVLTVDQFFTTNRDNITGGSTVYKMEMNPSGTTISQVSTFFQDNVNDFVDIAYYEDVLYGLVTNGSSFSLYEITMTGSNLLTTIPSTSNATGLVGVPGQNKLIVAGSNSGSVELTSVSIIGFAATSTVSYSPLSAGYDLLVHGGNVYVTGRESLSQNRTIRFALNGAGDPVGTGVIVSNNPPINFFGITKVVTSGGVTRFIASGTTSSLNLPSRFYTTDDIESGTWSILQDGPINNQIKGMSSLNG